MTTSWSLRLLTVIAGTLLIASTTPAGADILTQDAQLDGPIIFPSGNYITLQTGQNFTLSCRGKKGIKFKQQESPEDPEFITEKRNATVSDSVDEVELIFYKVDRTAVGYYACFDDTVDSAEVLADVVEEPNNTAHISYIYIYVNGSDMFAPMRGLVLAKSNSTFIIECRPTTPDIKVKLTLPQSNKMPETVKFSPKIGFIFTAEPKRPGYKCEARRGNDYHFRLISNIKHPPPLPAISGGEQNFLEGETFSINCTVETKRNTPVELSWTIPGQFTKVINESNAFLVRTENPTLYNNYTIVNASEEDAGPYVCTSKNNHEHRSVTFMKQYLSEPFINITNKQDKTRIIATNPRLLQLAVKVDDYPRSDITLLCDNNPLPAHSKIITRVNRDLRTGIADFIFTIRPVTVKEMGNYTVVASNRYKTENLTFDIRVPAPPKVDFESKVDKRYLKGTTASLICDVIGYPLPSISWIFSYENGKQLIDKTKHTETVKSLYNITSVLEIPVNLSGNITCEAVNELGNDSASQRFLVYDLLGGFGIKNNNQTWFSENDKIVLTCLASIYDFTNVTWYGTDYEEMESDAALEHFNSSLAYNAKLEIERVSMSQAGGAQSQERSYMCVGLRNNGTEENETITITVAAMQPILIRDPTDETEEVLPYHSVNFTCTASAVPPPQIIWYKDDKELQQINVKIINEPIDLVQDPTTRRSTVKISQIQEENTGKYECRANNTNSHESYSSKIYNVLMKEKPSPHKVTYLSVIGAIFFVLILLVVYLAWKIRKEKQFRKELAAAGLLNFKEGVTKSINPDLGIDEQAELLPYDEKFEFPADKLIFGKQLGAGAFGVVYKADARGIINAEEATTVAVKMVKKTADNMYIKALASELKIMVHLGKHVNIVNLLGACTKNVGKRELIVIVEYCKYGNIHNYMQKHREVFIDQLTDNPEKNLGKVNRGYSCSSGNSGMHSDYFGSNHTQDTDHTFLNTANTNRSARKVSESGYVQPEWRSNYESDYSSDGRSPRPLCSRDLLAWAFQIARGMEYLASRKVLHGDLAARNVLLADDNVVKICDFGLARSIYKNDEYQKKENSPLPVKWLAIECMNDRIFSTQSDVWSFGIVLWELFSLAKTPYPNISPPSLLDWLSQGHRLQKPRYADDKLYDVMMRCWQQKPNVRPSFSQLQQILGSFLEDNVRNHYVDLNATYMDMNIRREGEDYLAMVNGPDYNNIVTPSPHHYANDASGGRNFFPQTPTQTHLEHDDEGYLQMSPATRRTIFNARAQGTKFDFDARKLASRACEPNSYGSESTPMLTLNNLPRSGSESDHEGNSSPYLNMCPRIEEETDEVFETKLNNVKNIQPSAVTNPTYITFSTDDQKKLPNYTNNYINVNVPNGLVK